MPMMILSVRLIFIGFIGFLNTVYSKLLSLGIVMQTEQE